MSESNEDTEEESASITADPVAQDQAFQETYLETTGVKSNKSRGHGCMSTKSNKRVLQDRLEDQEHEIHRLKDMVVQKEFDKEAEKKQLVPKVKQELMQEWKTMMAENNNLLSTQEVMHENSFYNFISTVLN